MGCAKTVFSDKHKIDALYVLKMSLFRLSFLVFLVFKYGVFVLLEFTGLFLIIIFIIISVSVVVAINILKSQTQT